jgi:tau tubulin kinase
MPRVGFTGTSRYASVHAHKEKRLSRRDDLTSWFYLIVELAAGKLPWPAHAERSEIMAIKKTISTADLCGELPMQFREIWRVFRKLKFTDKPDYAWIKGMVKDVMKDVCGEGPHRYDWEEMGKEAIQRVSAIPLEMGPDLADSESVLYEPGCTDRCSVA